MGKFRVADIFCGAGGLSFGFYKNQNFKLLFANDKDSDALATYLANHKNVTTIHKDIKLLQRSDIEKFSPINVLLGGPPCQSYSTLGKRKMDERAVLFKEYLRILKILKPKIFIFENVTGILSMQKGSLFKEICSNFENLGYKITYKILNAVNFGVPQNRESFFSGNF